jgi:hypothetical protein
MRLHKEEKGSPFHVENRVTDKSLLKKNKFLSACYFAIDKLREGYTRQLVIDELESKNVLSKHRLEEVLSQATKIIESEYYLDHRYLLGLHLKRYQDSIKGILSKIEKIKELLPESDLDIFHKNKALVGQHLELLDVLFAKEKLLQLHNPKTIINYRTFRRTAGEENKAKKRIEYDFTSLSQEELVELLHLVEKSIPRDEEEFELRSMESSVQVVESNIQEVEFTEVIETTNIQRIEVIRDNNTDNINTPKISLIDIQDRMRRNFERQAQQLFNDAKT